MPCSFPPRQRLDSRISHSISVQPSTIVFRPILLLLSASQRVRPSVRRSVIRCTFSLSPLLSPFSLRRSGTRPSPPTSSTSSESYRVYNRNLSPIPVISPSAPVPIRRRIAPPTPSSLYPRLVSDRDDSSPGPRSPAPSSALNNLKHLVPLVIPPIPDPDLIVSLSAASGLSLS